MQLVHPGDSSTTRRPRRTRCRSRSVVSSSPTGPTWRESSPDRRPAWPSSSARAVCCSSWAATACCPAECSETSTRTRTPISVLLVTGAMCFVGSEPAARDRDGIHQLRRVHGLHRGQPLRHRVLPTQLRHTAVERLRFLVVPLVGAAVTLYMITQLHTRAITDLGLTWLAIGIVYLVWLTRGFRRPTPEMSFTHEQAVIVAAEESRDLDRNPPDDHQLVWSALRIGRAHRSTATPSAECGKSCRRHGSLPARRHWHSRRRPARSRSPRVGDATRHSVRY